jgi:hypothetical protein
MLRHLEFACTASSFPLSFKGGKGTDEIFSTISARNETKHPAISAKNETKHPTISAKKRTKHPCFSAINRL